VLMAEEIRCPHCGAPYRKKVPEWVTSLQCPYCGTAILIPKKETDSKISKIIYVEETSSKPQKSFSLADFSEFMRKKGYVVDPVSGALKMGTAILYISEEGIVEGPEPYKTRAEKWISEYMRQG
jgi:DNA-directed RNA polymerase subunit RPC12/RpoP